MLLSAFRSCFCVLLLALTSFLGRMVSLFERFIHTSIAQWSERLLPATGVWVFYITFAGQGVRNVIGWIPFGLLAAVSCAVFIGLFWLGGRQLNWRRIPVAVAAFVTWCCISIVWSFYPAETAVASVLMVATTLVGILMAVAFPLRQLLGILTSALQWTLVLSLLLELFVAAVMGEPLAPLYMWDWDHIPELYYWVRGDLFVGGPIQGVYANRNPLGFAALLALISFLMQWWLKIRPFASTLVWSALALSVIALTRSATVALCALSCSVVFVMVRYLRGVARERRAEVSQRLFVLVVFGALVSVVVADFLFALMGRSSDLTGRGVIWQRLFELWYERPVLGWGWIMYWAPWIPMFKTLVVRPDGTPTMQAHNAFIEALFQTGAIGAVLLLIAVVGVAYRLLKAAVRAPVLDASPVWAVLLLTALLVQSLSESRLLSEGNWVLFVAFATWLAVRGGSTRISDSLLSKREVEATPTK